MSKITLALLGFGVLLIGIGIISRWLLSENPVANHRKIPEELWNVYKAYSSYSSSRFLSVYIFNITNMEDFKAGGKPLLEELGPYVYQLTPIKTDVNFEGKNDYISFREPVYYHFRTDLTNGTLADKINTVSITYISQHAAAESFDTLTVDELLFKGKYMAYVKPLSKKTGSKPIYDHKYGFYIHKNGTDSGLLKISAGIENLSKFGKIISWNNMTKLPFWGENEYCNMINGSEGPVVFPSGVEKDTFFYVFRPELCRSLPLLYARDEEIRGVPGYRYTLAKSFLEDSSVNEDNECFCTSRGEDGKSCPKTGAYQLKSCRNGAPFLASLPHFLDGAEEYREEALGLNPHRKKHQTYFTISQKSGIILESHIRFQMNVELRSMRNMTLPLFWTDQSNRVSTTNPILKLTPHHESKKNSKGVISLIFDVSGCLLILMGVGNLVCDKWRNAPMHVNLTAK